MVGLGGLEPPTSRLSGVRSNQLSYRPMEYFFRGLWPLKTEQCVRTPECRPKDLQRLPQNPLLLP